MRRSRWRRRWSNWSRLMWFWSRAIRNLWWYRISWELRQKRRIALRIRLRSYWRCSMIRRIRLEELSYSCSSNSNRRYMEGMLVVVVVVGDWIRLCSQSISIIMIDKKERGIFKQDRLVINNNNLILHRIKEITVVVIIIPIHYSNSNNHWEVVCIKVVIILQQGSNNSSNISLKVWIEWMWQLI